MKVLILIPMENGIKEKYFDECSIVVSDGGLATINMATENLTIDYYQNRIKEHSDDIFEELAQGKMYYEDVLYSKKVTKKVIDQVLHLLVNPDDDPEFKIEYQYFDPKTESESDIICKFVLGYTPEELERIHKNIGIYAGNFMKAIALATQIADSENSLKLQRTFADEFEKYLNINK